MMQLDAFYHHHMLKDEKNFYSGLFFSHPMFEWLLFNSIQLEIFKSSFRVNRLICVPLSLTSNETT